MKDPRPLVQYVYEMQLEHYLDEMRSSGDDGLPSIDADLLEVASGWVHSSTGWRSSTQ